MLYGTLLVVGIVSTVFYAVGTNSLLSHPLFRSPHLSRGRASSFLSSFVVGMSVLGDR